MKQTISDPAIRPPAGVDPDYREKIATARAAREQGRRQREGRPITFVNRRSLTESS